MQAIKSRLNCKMMVEDCLFLSILFLKLSTKLLPNLLVNVLKDVMILLCWSYKGKQILIKGLITAMADLCQIMMSLSYILLDNRAENKYSQPSAIQVDENTKYQFSFKQLSSSKRGKMQKKSSQKNFEELSLKKLNLKRWKQKYLDTILRSKQPHDYPCSALMMLIVWIKYRINAPSQNEEMHRYKHRLGTAFLCSYSLLITAAHNIHLKQNEQIIYMYALSCTNNSGKAEIIQIQKSFILQQFKNQELNQRQIQKLKQSIKDEDEDDFLKQDLDKYQVNNKLEFYKNDIAILQIKQLHHSYIKKYCGHIKLNFQDIFARPIQDTLKMMAFPSDLCLNPVLNNSRIAMFGGQTKQYSSYKHKQKTIPDLIKYRLDTQSGVSGAPSLIQQQNGQITGLSIHVCGDKDNQNNFGKVFNQRDNTFISLLIEQIKVYHGLNYTKQTKVSLQRTDNQIEIDPQLIEIFLKSTISNQNDGLKCINKIQSSSLKNQIKTSEKQGVKIVSNICLTYHEQFRTTSKLSDELNISNIYLDKRYLISNIMVNQPKSLCLSQLEQDISQLYDNQIKKESQQLYFGLQFQFNDDEKANYYITSIDKQKFLAKSPQQLRVVQFKFTPIKITQCNRRQLTYQIIVDEGVMMPDDGDEHGNFIFKEDKDKMMHVIGTIDQPHLGKGKHFGQQQYRQWTRIIQKYSLSPQNLKV